MLLTNFATCSFCSDVKCLILLYFVVLIELQVKLLKTLAHTGSQRLQRAFEAK